MEQLHIELREMSRVQAVQGQMLFQIMEGQKEQTKTSVQQGIQISNLVIDVSVLKNDLSVRNNDIVSLRAFQADMVNTFMPRREQIALRHEERLKALEDRADVSADKQFSFLQWLMSNGITILFFLIMFSITIYTTLHK